MTFGEAGVRSVPSSGWQRARLAGRRSLRNLAVALALTGTLSGCVTKSFQQISTLNSPKGQARVVIMPVDVELSEVTASGMQEVKADWTESARRYLTQALIDEQIANGRASPLYSEIAASEERKDDLDQISKVHGAVGISILIHQYTDNMSLPSKNGRFDWTLGPAVRTLREHTDADYALYTFVRDSYTSAGRAAVMIAAAIMFGVAAKGGQQLGFASLVDLNTGNVVWFNRLLRGYGDLRTPEPARDVAKILLTGLPK